MQGMDPQRQRGWLDRAGRAGTLGAMMAASHTIVLTAAIAMLARAVAPAVAQQRPDFSGAWTQVDSAATGPSVASSGDAAFRRGDMGSGWGSPLTITQDGGRLTVQYVFFIAYDLQPPLRYVFALDGSESLNSVMIGHASSEQRSRAAWEGRSLAITTQYPAPDVGTGSASSATVRRSLTLAAADTLVIETTRLGVAGGAATTTRSVYLKR